MKKTYDLGSIKKGLHMNSWHEFMYEFMENMNSYMNS